MPILEAKITGTQRRLFDVPLADSGNAVNRNKKPIIIKAFRCQNKISWKKALKHIKML